jgi:hypothetical protein
MPVLGTQLFGFAAGDEECIPSQDVRAVVLAPRGLQAKQNGQIERGETRTGNAVYPLERRRFVVHPSGLDRELQSLREVECANGKRRTRQMQQTNQLQSPAQGALGVPACGASAVRMRV